MNKDIRFFSDEESSAGPLPGGQGSRAAGPGGRTSKAVLFLVMLVGLVFLGLDKLNDLNNALAYALIYVGAIINRLDSRSKNYKANISAGGVTATLETCGEYDDDPEPVKIYRARARAVNDKPEAGEEPGEDDPEPSGERLPNA